MSKTKTKLTGRVLEQAPGNFDWAPYDNGYCGGYSLVVNPKVKTHGDDKCFCHESYAQELYDLITNYMEGNRKGLFPPKDSKKGRLYNIVGIRKSVGTEVIVDTDAATSMVIDMNKERQYLDLLGISDPVKFVDAIDKQPGFADEVIKMKPIAKVLERGRISLWDGHLSRIEREFMAQIKDPNASPCAYNATVKEINNGGFIVDIMGVKCFLPGSLAAPGVVKDFDTMIGKTIPVMFINYIKHSGFVVSYKKYLNMVLPHKIQEELKPDMKVEGRITGTSKNGVFIQFRDKEGEWIFSGLLHRSVMSPEFEARFDNKEFNIGEEITAYINDIIQKDNQIRVVLSDIPDLKLKEAINALKAAKETVETKRASTDTN